MDYGLDGQEFESRQRLGIFLHNRVQTSFESHSVSYPNGTKGFFPGVKRAEA
jgi:hypothetical protein